MEIDVRRKILAANEEAAENLRRRFAETGTLAVNLISAPGSGKTTLLEATVGGLRDQKVGILVGDIATERDAERLRSQGVPARQILTGGACHLDARLVRAEYESAGFGPLDILFVENVGNLICPTSYDLGEDFKVVLLSVAEGEDKPFKYPGIFSRAAVTLITKVDLLPLLKFDLGAVREQIMALNREAKILEVSSYSGTGIEAWRSLLRAELGAKRSRGQVRVAE